MIVSKAKFNLQIFLTSDRAQSATAADVGSVLREKGLVKAAQNISNSAGDNAPAWAIACFFQQN